MINLRTATSSDNNQLVELARLTPMHGTISICIQREPDFFALLYKKGTPHIIIAEENNVIIGCVSIVEEEMVLLNQPTAFHYLCDLKVHPNYRNKKIGTRLSKAMHQYLIEIGSDYLFSTVADGNKRMMALFNGKAGIENVGTVGKFYILQLIPQKSIKLNNGCEIIEYSNDEKVVQMHQTFYARYVLHPVINAQTYLNCRHYAALKNNEPIAIVSLYDPKSLKQNVLINLPWYFSLAVKALRLTKNILNIPYLPHKGERINILYVKSFSYLPGHEDAFISLLSYAKQVAYKNNYSFLSITFHESDELRLKVKKFKAFPYKAHGMICSLKNNSKVFEQIKGRNVQEDFSLL